MCQVMDMRHPVFLKLWPWNVVVISDKYVPVISDKYMAIIFNKVCAGYIPQDKNAESSEAVISTWATQTKDSL